MADHSKTITEAQAAHSYVLHVLRDIKNTWSRLYNNLRETSGQRFEVRDQPMAALDLALAVVALETRAIETHFSPDQSQRLKDLILHYLNSPQYGTYARQEIESFGNAIESGTNRPAQTLAKVLLDRWLESSSPSAPSSASPSSASAPLLAQLEELLVAYSGVWKDSTEKFTLVRED